VTSAEDGGARFAIDLPVRSAAEAVEPAPAPPTAPAPAPLRVLVVDDEPAVLSLIQDMLAEDGHTVETVNDGRLVLERVAAAPFDVILSDMRMPAMSGRALHRAISEKHPHLARRMVFITGDTFAADTEVFLTEVGAPTVAKPFTYDELIQALRTAVERGEVAARSSL
jgi:two-component system NtrC family sensor kinase